MFPQMHRKPPMAKLTRKAARKAARKGTEPEQEITRVVRRWHKKNGS